MNEARTVFYILVNTLHLSTGTARYSGMTAEKDALDMVAGLIILAARTAPKARGQDTLLYKVIATREIKAISAWLAKEGKNVTWPSLSGTRRTLPMRMPVFLSG